MKFLLQEAFKSLSVIKTKKKIGFVIPSVSFYDKASASTRIRVYDIIQSFDGDKEFHLELYRSHRYYDLVCFLKTYDAMAQSLAGKLKRKGTQVIFDININIFEKGSASVSEQQREDGYRFATRCEAILTNSPHTLEVLKNEVANKPVYLINEAIPNAYFDVNHKEKSQSLRLIWVGYAHKAKSLLLIKDVLNQLHKTIPLKIIVIAEKQPDLSALNIPIEFRTYNHQRITKDLADADVFVAPRDLTDPYNLGHSFTKIGIAMAAGIPVVASPVPSYRASPAICCTSKADWEKALTQLHTDTDFRNTLIAKGKEYCMVHYGLASVKANYTSLFKTLLDQPKDL